MKTGLIFAWAMLMAVQSFGRIVTDVAGRSVELPERVERVICSGAGCLRLLTYLQAQSLVVAVDSAEKRENAFESRPYAIAHPAFKKFPLFGEFRGNDHPELILSLDPPPQVIFKTYAGMGTDPAELQRKTGIPVVVLECGNLAEGRDYLFASLDVMAEVVGKQARAKAVKEFFGTRIEDLSLRCKEVPESERLSVFIGGVAFKGVQDFSSTEPAYPPFVFTHARNLAADKTATATRLKVSKVAKEKILEWDPDRLFLDLSSLQVGDGGGALHELKSDPAYRSLSAVRAGYVYGVLPYNSYSTNYGSALANAYFIGKTLYPDRFTDVDPVAEADTIYAFLVGQPVFHAMNAGLGGYAFAEVPLR